MRFAARFAFALVALPLVACAVTPDQSDSSEGVANDQTAELTQRPPSQLPFPPPGAPYCGFNPPPDKLGARRCEATFDTSGVYDSIAASLGCSRPLKVTNPYPDYAGIILSKMMLCRDSDAVAKAVNNYHWGYARDLCTPCLPRAPIGQVYVVMQEASGPGCPSGCGKYLPGTGP